MQLCHPYIFVDRPIAISSHSVIMHSCVGLGPQVWGGKCTSESTMLRFIMISQIEFFANSNSFVANKAHWFGIGEIHLRLIYFNRVGKGLLIETLVN